MVARIKSAGLILAFLVMFFPFSTLAQNVSFSVIPAEVNIDNLLPGDVSQFELTIHNKDEIARNFTVTAFSPAEEQRREGRVELPDPNWISFWPPQITVAASGQANATITVAIPQEQKWAGRRWEIWLGVTPESSDLLAAKLCVRLLVSTSGTRSNPGFVASLAVAIVLLGYAGYHYFRRKAKSG